MKFPGIIGGFLGKFQGDAASKMSVLPAPVQDVQLDPGDSAIMMYVRGVFSDHLEPRALREAVDYCFQTYPTIADAHFSPLIAWVNENEGVKFYEIPVQARVQLWRGVVGYFGSSFAATAETLPADLRSIPDVPSSSYDKRRDRAVRILSKCFAQTHFDVDPIADAEQIYPFKAATRKFYVQGQLNRFHRVDFVHIAEADRRAIYRSILYYFDLTEEQFRYPRIMKVTKYSAPNNGLRGDSIRR